MNASKAYRKAMGKAIFIAAIISCAFGIMVIPLEHWLDGTALTVSVWLLKLITGTLSVLVGAEACKECLSRKHAKHHPNCNHWGV